MSLNTERQTSVPRPIIQWISDAWFLAKPYWISRDRYIAIALISGVVILNLLMVYLSVQFNSWYNLFYDAIQKYDRIAFFHLIGKWSWLAIIYVIFAVLAFYLRKLLEVRWRRWLTKYYLDMWFSSGAYHKNKYLEKRSDNPDQRISEDINSFLILLLDLSLGLITSVVTLVSFVSILWGLSGSLKFTMFGHNIAIHGYMVWVALIYAGIGTYITFKIGKPLVKLDFYQQAYEADFRFSLTRVREHSENIAFYKGESQEKQNLLMRYSSIVNNFLAIVMRQLKISIFGIGYSLIANIFPIIVSAPRYFAKEIQLGGLMQIANTFGKVQDALSYFIQAFTSLAGWRATMDRLCGFQLLVKQSIELTGLGQQVGEKYLELDNVSVMLPNGNFLIQNLSLSLNKGDSLLIKGRSGSGKTTLLRTIAGLWHYASGNIKQADGVVSLFIAQRSYLPIGTLHAAICYPKMSNLPNTDELHQLMRDCKIENLIPYLDVYKDWGGVLSIGEQQRIGFCRVLINSPDIVYLDEATSAIDEDTEAELYAMIKQRLPNALIISIGHRSTIAKWHEQELNFNTHRL